MGIAIDLIHNLALLAALSVAAGLLGRPRTTRRREAMLQGAIMGVVAVIGMLTPLVLEPGLHFDGRSVAIGLGALYFGPWAAAVSSLMAVLCRLLQGGTGTLTGVFVIASSALIGTIFHYQRARQAAAWSLVQLWGFGVLLHAAMLLLMFTLPGGAALAVLPRIALPVLIAFPLATVLIGKILSDQEARLRFVEQLRESEERFRATLYSIGDGVITTDRQGRVREMNPVAEEMTGWQEHEARGQALESVFTIVTEDDRTRVENPALHALREGRVVELANHTLLISREGTEHPIADSGAPIRGADGEITGVVLVFRDQRSERAAERALRQSEERFARALEHVPDVMVIYDTELRIQYINEATRQVTGRPTSDFIGKRDDEAWPPEVCDVYVPTLREALRSRQVQVLDTELTLPAIGRRHLLITCLPMLGPDGEVREVLGITHDYTLQQAAAAALRAGEERFRTVFNQQFQFMAILSPDGTLLEINELMLRAGQVSRGEAVGRLIWETPWWRDLPAMRAAWPARLAAAARAEEPVLSLDEFMDGTGAIRLAEAAVSAVRDDSGSPAYFIVQASDVTERVHAREELLAAKNLLQCAFDSLSEAVLVIDSPTGNIIQCNRAVEKILGYTAAELMGQSARRLHASPEGDATFDAECEAVLAGGGTFCGEYPLLRKDGTVIQAEITVGAIQEDRGSSNGMVSVIRDITERNLNEDRLRRMAARLSTTLESITDAFYTLDRQWRFTYLNAEAERLLQRPKEELLGRVAGKEFPEIIGSEVEKQYNRAVHENCTVEFETFYAPLNTWFELHAYPSEEGLAVYFRDITERVKSEQAMRTLSERLQGILDFSPLLIAEIDTESRCLLANNAVADLVGLETSDIMGKTLGELLPEETAHRFMSRILHVQMNHGPLLVEDALTIDGNNRIFSTTVFPLFDPGGGVRSVGAIAQEITARKRAEEDHEKLEEQLRQAQKMDAIGRLAGGVAHDFNNMLGVILGYTDMALETMPPDHPIATDLRQVHIAATHSADLTRQLLAFARKQTIVPEVLDLNENVASILKMLRRIIGEDIELQWKPGREIGPVRVDPTQIDQILANLTVNARDAIGGIGKIIIETGQSEFDENYCECHPGHLPGSYVLLAVSDDGCGMSKEIQTQIFEPFFTTKALGSGTGLGLATVYGIVKQNNGFISVYSEPGRGTTFRIYIPRYITPANEGAEGRKTTSARTGTETVLLVEDERALLRLGERLLQRLGYNVIAANGPAQALTAVAEYSDPIHLVISDVIMPEMNGRDLWEQLNTLRPGMKSLFMSGYTADVIAHHGALDEGVHFLQKPFSLDSLAEKIREALES